MFGRDLFFRLAHRTGVIELFHQFRTIEHSILKFVVEIEGTVRAIDHAKHAIHALAVIVNVVIEDFFLASVLVFHHLRFDDDCIVGTHILAHAAAHTFVLVEFVVRQNELTAKALEHLVLFAVFGIAFRDFRRPKLAHRGFQTSEQSLDSSDKSGKVILIFHRWNVFVGGLLDETTADEQRHADEQHHRNGNEVFPLETQDLIDTQAGEGPTLPEE